MPNLTAAFFSIVFLLPLITAAQGTLTGTVTSDGQPLENTSVISSKGAGATTNKDGKYSLRLSAGSHSITFSSVGYTSQTVLVTITDGQQTVQNIILQVSTQGLENVLIVGTRSLPRSVIGTPLPVDNLEIATLKAR